MRKIGESALTRQGQIGIPKKVCEKLHLKTGGKIIFLEGEKGQIIIQEAEVPIEFTKTQWDEFLRRSLAEPVTRVRGKEEALKHLDKLRGRK